MQFRKYSQEYCKHFIWGQVVTTLTMASAVSCMELSNHYIGHLDLIWCQMSTVLQLNIKEQTQIISTHLSEFHKNFTKFPSIQYPGLETECFPRSSKLRCHRKIQGDDEHESPVWSQVSCVCIYTCTFTNECTHSCMLIAQKQNDENPLQAHVE